MLLAIHNLEGSFSDRWIEYCELNDIPYIKVDMFRNDLLDLFRQSGVSGFLFQLSTLDPRTHLVASFIGRAAEMMGIKVFPCDANSWYFNDKLAQKYLFEALAIPSCPTWIFYSPDDALTWAKSASYPKVFKLRRGASSYNVCLVSSFSQARRLIQSMFGSGLRNAPDLLDDYQVKIHKHSIKNDWVDVLKRLPFTLSKISKIKNCIPNERGYVYFQEFLPDNRFDTRITVIGQRAFAFRRFVRPKDFRASGSGRLDFETNKIDFNLIKIAFDSVKKIKSQSLAFDFVYDIERRPVVLEVCRSYAAYAVFNCSGYWDPQMNFHEGHIWPQDAIMIDLLESLVKPKA